jgi:hypothetical protein
MVGCPPAQGDAMPQAHCHMHAIRRHIGVARQQVFTVGGDVDWKTRSLRQPFDRALYKPGGHMLHDEHGHGEVFGQSR